MKTITKESLNAKAVAEEVIDNIVNNRQVNIEKISKKHGYSVTSARAHRAADTKTYKKTMSSFVDKLVKDREEARELLTKKKGQAKYRDLIEGIDKMTKVTQLLGGDPTEIEEFNINL